MDMVDIAQLALCAQLFSKAHTCSEEAKVQMERMVKIQEEYADIKKNMMWDGDLKTMDQLLKEETGARQLYKMFIQQESEARKHAISISASFGLTPADRLKFAELIAKNQEPDEEGSSKDVTGDNVSSVDDLL
jgi:phage terminase small subunit